MSVIFETVKIMGVIIKFKDLEDFTELEIINFDNCIQIGLDDGNQLLQINLDIETAVKLSKELRRQIAIAKDYQLNNESNEQ